MRTPLLWGIAAGGNDSEAARNRRSGLGLTAMAASDLPATSA